MRLLAALLLVPALLCWADETKKTVDKPKKAGEVEIPDPGTKIEDGSVARREVARFESEWKAAKSHAERHKALDRLGKWDHPEIVKAAARHMNHKHHPLAVAAISVVARQVSAKKKAAPAMMKLLKKAKRTDVICALLIGLGKIGYDKKDAINVAKSNFRKDTKERHKAATRYFGYIKHKPAFRALAERLDEPRPKNPDDPTNPPASYWKERWFEWQANVPFTRWAISQLVPGETFDQAAEAQEWAKTEGKAHGISWKLWR